MKQTLCFFFQIAALSGCLSIALEADGQQTPYSNFYRANWQMVNPAAIDRSHYLKQKHNMLVFNGGFRQQWIGLEGAPRTFFASVEWCPEQENKQRPGIKMGGTIIQDRTDAIGTLSFLGNDSYYFQIGGSGGRFSGEHIHILHLGLSGRVNQYSVDMQKLRAKDPNDPIIDRYDPNYWYGDVSVGVMYRRDREFYIGVSVPSTLKMSFRGGDATNFSKEIRRHFFLMTGGFIAFGPPAPNDREARFWMLEPSFWLRAVPGLTYNTLFSDAPFSFDINMRLHYQQRLWFGGGLGSNKMVQVEFGYVFSKREHSNNIGTKIQTGLSYSFPAGGKYLAFGHSVELTFSYYGL